MLFNTGSRCAQMAGGPCSSESEMEQNETGFADLPTR